METQDPAMTGAARVIPYHIHENEVELYPTEVVTSFKSTERMPLLEASDLTDGEDVENYLVEHGIESGEKTAWIKAIRIEEEYKANQARAEWIKQAKIADLADELEDFYYCPGEIDQFSGLAGEQIRMIASWLSTRSWQTILPTISTHTNKATRPAGAAEKAVWTDTRSSIWAQKATWNDMHRTGWNEAATSDEEDWQ